ncbi:hypothetical protein ACS5PN_31235 [Roseateles sp. NT4]|uniref:hypothetical protein n=1 Tax=Roseateles sp. NT4 TaxID=3453715 RepID=UPI003EF06D74
MPSRQKTRLTPDEQWSQTVRYSQSLHDSDSIAQWLNWKEKWVATRISEIELREHWSAECHKYEIVPRAGRSDPVIAVITRPHRWLHVGDVFFVTQVNGMNERFAVNGVSSKGVRLKDCFFRLDHGTGQGVMRICFLPKSLTGLRWDGDAVTRFVHESRAEVLGE